jgi:hypothetical protein
MPPIIPATTPDNKGAPEASEIPRQSGSATKKTTTEARISWPINLKSNINLLTFLSFEYFKNFKRSLNYYQILSKAFLPLNKNEIVIYSYNNNGLRKFVQIKTYYEKWKNKTLTDAQYALAFFLFYHCKKYPSKQIQNYLAQNQLSSTALQNFVFKKVKAKALMALKKWNEGLWQCQVLDYIPTPYEVLNFQAQGIRPVTLLLQDDFKTILHKEDCLEFMLHDLEHGHMFFYDLEKKQMQLQFFKNVQESLKTPLWHKHLEDDAFKEKFYYLISDMNTHLEHYRYYLKSMIDPGEFDQFEWLFN